MKLNRIGIDLVKNIFQLHGVDDQGKVVFRRRLSRPNMRFVKPKTVSQQDIQAVHRIRQELMSHRTAKANQIRGLVTEYGMVAPLGLAALRSAIPCWLEDAENGLTVLFRSLLCGHYGRI